MASAHWRTNHTVASLLQEPDIGWNFLQLIKVLLLVKQKQTAGDDSELLNSLTQCLRFRSSMAVDFPPSEVRHIKWQPQGSPVDVELAYGGLSTKDGPLPETMVEWIHKLKESDNHAMADFIDLFTNRLGALRYLISRSTRPGLMDTSAEKSDTGKLLHALSGVRYNRQCHRSDLKLAGLLANSRMSFPVIKQMVAFSMGLPLVALNPYQGGWARVDAQDHSRLGQKDVCVLGSSASLGNRVWDQQQGVEWVFGPLNWVQVKQLIPHGDKHQEFAAMLARITDCRYDCNIALILPQEKIPSITLGDDLKAIPGITLESELEPEPEIETPREKLALGLTTTLPVAEVRKDKSRTLKIKFTIKTSHFLNKAEAGL